MNVRDQLLAAAARVYAEAGYHGATTRRIASAAGVNEITLFRHFGSKDALLREAIAQCQGADTPQLPAEPADPVAELTEWSRAHLQHLHERAPLIRTCLADFAEHPELVNPEVSCPLLAVSALAEYLGRLKQRGQVSGAFDERVAAGMLMGVLFADAMGRDILPQMYPTQPEQALRQYVKLFLNGIGLAADAPRGVA
jgi:AcrR family transcriptional regulator